MENKLKLYGFNNLTKALSFNIYDVCYAKTEREQQKYIAYIDEQYNSDRLVKILTNVSQMIGAEVLNISKQDYDPQGASVTLLLAEDAAIKRADSRLVLGHLDKSHVTAHTYPEYHPETCIATFRVDIDVETCGEITPLSTLDYLIGSFDSDIITLDYRVRGFTRDVSGKKLFIDHDITSIQDYIDAKILARYDAIDINVYQANLFHTNMLKDLVVYLRCTLVGELCRYPSGFPQLECNVVSTTGVEHNVLYWCVRSALYVIPSVQLAGFTTLTLSFVLGFLVDGTLLRVLHSWVFA